MPSSKSVKFTRRGGHIVKYREIMKSPAYRDLSANARCVMDELQSLWRPSEPVIHLSVERAGELINRSPATGSRALKELWEHGFIRMKTESDWFNGMAREWLSTWMPNLQREPTDDWKQWTKTR